MMRRRGATHPRSVLLACVLFVALSAGLYVIGPCILPVRIVEGPLVQEATEDSATLVWYTTRAMGADDCVVTLEAGDVETKIPVETTDTRNVAHLSGLSAGEAYPYKVKYGGRTLAAAELHTNKSVGQPVAFIVFGDSGRGTREQYELAARMNNLIPQPDFLLHTGDLVYGDGSRARYRNRFFAPYKVQLERVNFWPALGNHDVQTDDGQPYLDVFELPENGPAGVPPERNYWFDYGDIRVAVVDSTADEQTLATQIAPWLRTVMSERAAGWKFVALHHPPYTGGHYKPDVRIQRTLVPVFEETGVDIVFAGHDHMYERTAPLREGEIVGAGEGVVYVVTGAGGAQIYEPLPEGQRPAYIVALDAEHHSFTSVKLNGPALFLQQIATSGDVLDEWSYEKARTDVTSQPANVSNADSQPVVPVP